MLGADIHGLKGSCECFAGLQGIEIEISRESGADTLLLGRTFIQPFRDLDVMLLNTLRQFSGEPIEIALGARHQAEEMIDEARRHPHRRGQPIFGDFIPVKHEARAHGVAGSAPVANVRDDSRQRYTPIARVETHTSLGAATGADDLFCNGLRARATRIVDGWRMHDTHRRLLVNRITRSDSRGAESVRSALIRSQASSFAPSGRCPASSWKSDPGGSRTRDLRIKRKAGVLPPSYAEYREVHAPSPVTTSACASQFAPGSQSSFAFLGQLGCNWSALTQPRDEPRGSDSTPSVRALTVAPATSSRAVRPLVSRPRSSFHICALIDCRSDSSSASNHRVD